MSKKKLTSTKICGYDSDSISIRGKDLVTDLMGKLSFTEMIFFQLTGNMPSNAQTTILNAVLVTIMEHGLVPSATVSRLTYYGAPESFQGAVAAGLLGVGDRFVGTASECAKLLEALVNASDAEQVDLAKELVSEYKAQKKALPGFGHSMHKTGDPRVLRLLEIVESVETEGKHIKALEILAQEINTQIPKNLVTNVSAAIAASLGEAGIDPNAIRGIIMTARCAGLTGHVYEEMQNPIAESIWRSAEEEILYKP